jgi:putative DNA primase/helicase
VLILRHDPRLTSLRMSSLGGVIEWERRPVGEGQITADLAVWLSAHYRIDLQPHLIYRAVEQVARERVYSPVEEYLRALRWDGEPRVGRVLREVLGVEATPLHEAYLLSTLKAAVARAFQPGCKADTALVLIGGQGAGKSTFFRVLFGAAWFGDSPIPIGEKDAAIQLQRCWGYEAAEMESLTRRSAEEVKQFMSTSRDLVRLPYQRQAEFVPRHSVLVGTVNRGQFLTDETGSRRFWPLQVPGRIDVALLERLRDQLWAEAVVSYHETPVWWLSETREAERVEASAQHLDLDLWEDVVRGWLEAPQQQLLRTTVLSEVLSQALGVPLQVQDDRAKRRIGAVMQRLGWAPRTIRDGGAVRRVWTRIGPTE